MPNRNTGILKGLIFTAFVIVFIVLGPDVNESSVEKGNFNHTNNSNNTTKANAIDPMCNIIVYTSDDCGLCDAAVKALESKRVRFCNKDINRSKKHMETYDSLGGGSCGPVAVIGNTVIKGYSYKFSKASYARAIDKMNSTY